MVRRILIVNPDNRPRLEEIKNTSFYKRGMKILEKQNIEHDPALINEQVYINMNLMGISKEEVQKNVEQRKFNNIRTTYELLYNKIKLNKTYEDEALSERHYSNRELLKINDKKYQININVTNKIDNLNINFKGNDTNSNILEYKNKIASKIYI